MNQRWSRDLELGGGFAAGVAVLASGFTVNFFFFFLVSLMCTAG